VKRISKFLIVISALSVLGGCSTIKGITGGGDKKTTPTIGKRIDILGTETDSKADPALENISVILPPAQVNADWAQPGGNASKAIGHVALGDGLSRAWTASIQGGSNRARLGASPVVSGGKLFAVDTEGQVVAFDAKSGARLWRTSLEIKKDGRPSAFGGGASAEGDMVYATNGAGDVSAVRADTGAIVWQKRPAGPLRGSPTLSNGNVYVMTQDNQIYALRASDGNTEWNESGPVGVSGIFGVGAPSAAQSTVIAGYSTGEFAMKTDAACGMIRFRAHPCRPLFLL
jgi:outer membrane protein assembly factor BamB